MSGADRYRIDSHKLIYHPERVSEWLAGEDIYPIYMEVSPVGACNHRCVFCAFDYLGYKPRFIDSEIMLRTLDELGRLGVKSIMYAGEGEPFLHKDMVGFIRKTKGSGIDAAVATNGVLFTPEKMDECLADLTWVRLSLNAGTAETYKAIHRGRDVDFDVVMENIAYATKLKREKGLKTTIGAQLVLIKENFDEVETLARRLKELGADYLTVKPFIQHLMSGNVIETPFSMEELLGLKERSEKISGDGFRVIFRAHAMEKIIDEERTYDRCLGLPFFAEILSNGDVYACGPYLGDEHFLYGNLGESTFEELWHGETRRKVLERVASMDCRECMKNCRLDEINRYLWELAHPSEHVNFI